MKLKLKAVFLVSLYLLALAHFSSAQLVTCGHSSAAGTNECQLQDLVITLIKIINTLMGLSWLVAVFFVFWGGWGMVNSAGNPEKLKEGKSTFTNAIIGFFLIMVSFLLVNFVVSAFTGKQFDLDTIRSFIPLR
jgi:hypothetical protein